MLHDKEQDPAAYWRDRYLSLLSENNEIQAQSVAKEELWRNSFLLMSQAAEGQTPSIDNHLHELRLAVNTHNFTTFNELLSALRTDLDTFHSHNAQQQALISNTMAQAMDHLGRMGLSKSLLKRIKKISHQAQHELAYQQGHALQLAQWLNLLNDLAQQDRKPRTLGFKRWFHPTPVPPSTTTDDDYAQASKDAARTLQNLLQQIVIAEPLATLKKQLCRRLDEELSCDELAPILESTSQFLLECLQSNQSSLERFLHNLDQRLQAIRLLVSDASQNQNERYSVREHFGATVLEQLSDIDAVLIDSTELPQLTDSVRNHLTRISHALKEYQTGEEHRDHVLTEQLTQLQQRLNQTEKELSESRQILELQKHKATTDSLTGLPNREAYELRLAEEYARFTRYHTPLSLLIVDVDFFKKINDTYGHLAGDKVLMLIAQTLQKNIRDVDFIGRFGGEEFVILMPNTNLEQAFVAAEKLRKTIEVSPFNFRQERVFITVSIGVAEFQADESPESVFERADTALYHSKSTGRNSSYQG